MENICAPPKKQMTDMSEAQPVTLASRKKAMTDQAIPTRLKSIQKIPNPVIKCIGFIERLVIPSKASFNIFPSG